MNTLLHQQVRCKKAIRILEHVEDDVKLVKRVAEMIYRRASNSDKILYSVVEPSLSIRVVTDYGLMDRDTGALYQHVQPTMFTAVHFNLDCDWIVYMCAGWGNYVNKYKDTTDESVRNQTIQTYCGEHGTCYPQIKRMIVDAAESTIQATHQHHSKLHPLFVVTSIGKPGHTEVMWALDLFTSLVKQGNATSQILVGTSTSQERDLLALEEFLLASESRLMLTFPRSTFSAALKRNVKRKGGLVSNLKMRFPDSAPRSVLKS